MQLNRWMGQYFCLKELREYIYTANRCTNLEKSCLDVLCVDSGSECPVSGAREETLSLPKGVKNTLQLGNRSVQLTQDAAGDSAAPIVDLRVAVRNDSFCLDPEMNPQLERRNSYPLEARPYDGCGRYGSSAQRMLVLDSQPLEQFYTENGQLAAVQSLPYSKNYDWDAANNVYLLGVTRIAVGSHRQCLEFDDDGFTKASHTLFRTNALAKLLASVSLFAIAFVAYSFFVHAHKLWEDNSPEAFERFRVFSGSFMLLFFANAFCYCTYRLILALNQDGAQFCEQLRNYVELGCFNDLGITEALRDAQLALRANLRLFDSLFDVLAVSTLAATILHYFSLSTIFK